MIVEQIWTGNSLRNFNYLLACPDTGEALAIDPLDYEKCLSKAKKKGWDITQILNTHEHGDHTGGNQAMISATKAKLLAHEKSNIPGMDIGLKSGDVVRIGKTVELLSLDTPGHTMSHVCLLSKTDQPSIFSGDTLFNAGAGNCHHGGHPEELYLTFTKQLAKLPNNTLIYPGHDYIENNLMFTLNREPENKKAKELLGRVANQDLNKPLVTNIGLEKEINTFFRLNNPVIIEKLKENFPEMRKDPDKKEIFLKLREIRNEW
tara:strand:+ start:185 stop:970 length:786 start_codon:yes stop_codon:yes gene_type:complete